MSDDASGDDGFSICYVRKKILDAFKESLKKGEEVKPELVKDLMGAENVDDEELMVPVDMSGVGVEMDDPDSMMKKLGAKGVAEAFVKAEEMFEKNKEEMPEEHRPKPITAREWMLLSQQEDGESEMDGMEAEEEESDDDAFDEEVDLEAEDDAAAAEPAAKKAKTKAT
eukprot:TRINITY_DN105394_c0_g1_i1.p2 TRINITY_DN105394_c0_g1~~TRINITY_DN105394_c0_g1_i1.p2  ORF type:complete len:169 (-),score=73.11 TRINITY_DN105394_c0_g1_i1:218-724(-)